MTTPEGKVKKAVKRILDPLKPRVWYDMPVPGGWGKSTLDFVGSAYGHPFAIEAKALGGKATPRQHATIRALEAAGVQCFVDPAGLFTCWSCGSRRRGCTTGPGRSRPSIPRPPTIIDEVIATVVVPDTRNYSQAITRGVMDVQPLLRPLIHRARQTVLMPDDAPGYRDAFPHAKPIQATGVRWCWPSSTPSTWRGCWPTSASRRRRPSTSTTTGRTTRRSRRSASPPA
jgi:hypothetical protein